MNFTFYSYFADRLMHNGPEDAADFAKKLGFSGVEMLEMPFAPRYLIIPDVDAAKKLKAALDSRGITMSCFSVGVNIFADKHGQGINISGVEVLKKCAENAAALGCPYMHHTLTIGLKTLPFDAPMTFEGMFDELCDRAEEVARYANSLGVTVIYEPQGSFVNGLHNFEVFYNEMKRRGVQVGVCGDIGNTLFVDEDPTLFFEKFAREIRHVHLKDYVKNCKEDYPEGAWSNSAGGTALAETDIGKGIIDIDACMASLLAVGYKGHFAIESVYPKSKYSPDNFVRDMEYLKAKYPEF